MLRPLRWGDNDRYSGPFTLSRNDKHYNPLQAVLGSGDGDDYPGCFLRLSLLGYTLIVALPPIVKPHRRHVVSSAVDPETGRPRYEYWDQDRKEYGVSYHEELLRIFYGAQTDSSDTDKLWMKSLPWTQWRFTGRHRYGLNGELLHAATAHARRDDYQMTHREQTEYSRTFAFFDHDGEHLAARTYIEETEHQFGTGWFKWLSWFRQPRVTRFMSIEFSGETGPRKGSWKGGTLGHGITLFHNELHAHAFRRYCAANNMIADPVVNLEAEDDARWESRLLEVPVDIAEEATLEQAIHALLKMGFRLVYHGFQPSDPPAHQVYILAHPIDGLLLRIDMRDDGARIGGTTLYYNWVPRLFPNGLSLHAVRAGRLIDGVWVGHHDGLAGIGHTLALLRATGAFVAPWKHTPRMRLWHGSDSDSRGRSNETRNASVIEYLPPWVRDLITPETHTIPA